MTACTCHKRPARCHPRTDINGRGIAPSRHHDAARCTAGVANLEDASVMQRMRSTWMALIGGILLVTLSLSAALGAPPADSEGPRGQSIATFVHGLVFGQQAPDDEPDVDQEETDEEAEETEENLEPDELEELNEELAENELDEEADDEAGTHGACVSAVAKDKDGDNDPEDAEYRNHGARVSEAARVLCRASDDEEALDEENLDDEAEAGETTAAGNGRPSTPGAHGRDNAPGQQKAHAAPKGNGTSGPGNAGGGRGHGRGGR
jgi:hypothetical protein